MLIPLGFLAASGAGEEGAYELIESSILTTSTSSVTFSSIPSDYKHLQLRIVYRGANAGNGLTSQLRFNSDSGSNYAYHRLQGDGSTVVSSAFTSQTEIDLPAQTANGATASSFGGAVVDILDYASTSKNTTVRTLGGRASTSSGIDLRSGLWINTAAVTSVFIGSYTLNFMSGSRFSLYGIKA
jgi:hypothetical protein